MRDENKYIPCSYGADAAAFIYDELPTAEREKFAGHLAVCGECADEIADFNLLRSSIQAWKIKDFDCLPTPRVVIPAASPNAETAPTFFEKIRAYINFAPVFSAGLAVALIAVVGIGWFLLRQTDAPEIASNVNRQPQNPSKIAAPNIKKPEIEIADSAKVSDADLNKENTDDSEINRSNEKSAPRVIKSAVSDNRRNIQKPANDDKTAGKIQPREKKSFADNKTLEARKLPRLNNLPDEDDAEDLRLSDLFTDSGSK